MAWRAGITLSPGVAVAGLLLVSSPLTGLALTSHAGHGEPGGHTPRTEHAQPAGSVEHAGHGTRAQESQAHEHGAVQAGGADAQPGGRGKKPGMAPAADGGAGPPPLPAESPLAWVRLHDEAREAEIVIGPVALPAGGPHLRPQVQLAELPMGGWLHGFSWEMRDADGARLPDRLLHHVNLIDPDRRELFSAVPRRVLAAGRETSREMMPRVLGYPVEPGTRLLVSSMFASRPDESFDAAYLHITIPFTPADDPGLVRPFAIFPFYLDVMGPVGAKEFPLPPGTHGMSWEGSPAVDGRILGLGGHLHDYADWIRLEDVTAGKVLWETAPTVDENGQTVSVPTSMVWWRGGLRLRKDHTYRVSVQYSNPLNGLAPDGGMGAIGGIVLVGGDEWPEFSRNHPDYVADLQNTLEKPNEAGHTHEH